MTWKYFWIYAISLLLAALPYALVNAKLSTEGQAALAISGIATVILAVIYTDLDKANARLKRQNEYQISLSQELKETREAIATSIARQINAEHSLLKIVLKDSSAGKYFDNLINLHSMLDRISKGGSQSIISSSIGLMIKSTQYIEDFFKQNELGGIYKIAHVVELYRSIGSLSESLIVVEPKNQEKYEENYDGSYINFIESDMVENIKEKEFIFLDQQTTNVTTEWLKKHNFKVSFKGNIRTESQREQDYLTYSHVIFKVGSEYISCSVLPTAARKSKRNGLTNFNLTEEVYLAFRVFRLRDESDNYDSLVQALRLLISRK